MLCFTLVLKTVLITQGYLSYHRAVLMQHQGLLYSAHRPRSMCAGSAQNVGRGHNHDSWPNWSKEYSILYDTILTSESWEHRERLQEKRLTFKVKVFAFPRNGYKWWSSAALEMAAHLLLGSTEWMSYAVLPVNAAFCFTHTLPIHEFSFTFLIFSPNPTVGRSEFVDASDAVSVMLLLLTTCSGICLFNYKLW